MNSHLAFASLGVLGAGARRANAMDVIPNTARKWDAGDNQFFCTKHKSRYRADGTFIEGRATRDMDRLPIRKDGSALVVDIDGLIQQDEHQKEWTSAFVAI